MIIRIVNKSKHELQNYETEALAVMDLHANLDKPICLKPLERKMVPTGLFMELLVGFEGRG